ncbi:MAG TPA: hypothetical protein VJ251_12170 [Stellaceae bacterium]|nr:hypothetical protein [Stellaceae bacterium]
MDHKIGAASAHTVYGVSRVKLGLFGANCSSSRAITLAPERWTGPR